MPRRRKHGKQGEPMVAASSPSTPSPADGNEMAGPVQKATLTSGAAGATPPRPPHTASSSAGLGASRQMVGAPEASNLTTNNRMSAKTQINSDQDIRNKMVEMDSSGSANVEDDQPVNVDLKTKGLILFFAGMPGCLNSDLCQAILNSPASLGDNIPFHYMKEDLVKGKYWKKVADERRKQPARVILADKNAPNEAVWNQIEEMCRTKETVAIPVIPDCEGTDSNPFSLEALAVCMFRVLKTVDRSEFFEKTYNLLKSYHLFNGKKRIQFENELYQSFGSLVKMPLLSPNRAEMPCDVQYALESGISLFRLNEAKDGSVAPSQGPYSENWVLWKERLDTALSKNTNYLVSIQVPWDFAVEEVLQKLKSSCEKLISSTTLAGARGTANSWVGGRR